MGPTRCLHEICSRFQDGEFIASDCPRCRDGGEITRIDIGDVCEQLKRLRNVMDKGWRLRRGGLGRLLRRVRRLGVMS